MELKDLFVSYKQVEPIKSELSILEDELPVYLNASRAKKIVNGDVTEDMSDWKVGGNSEQDLNWVVRYGKVSPVDQEEDKKQKNQNDDKNIINKWINIYKGKKEEWARDLIKAYKSIGLSDNAIVNLLSKNALETGWGQSAQGNFNFGNITAGSTWNGDIVIGNDTDADGNPITQRWRAYRDLKHFVQDEVDFLKRLYEFDPNDDLEAFLGKLQDGKRKYAEARDYKDKVRAMKAGVLRRVKQYG